jgi:hypothetical protein
MRELLISDKVLLNSYSSEVLLINNRHWRNPEHFLLSIKFSKSGSLSPDTPLALAIHATDDNHKARALASRTDLLLNPRLNPEDHRRVNDVNYDARLVATRRDWNQAEPLALIIALTEKAEQSPEFSNALEHIPDDTYLVYRVDGSDTNNLVGKVLTALSQVLRNGSCKNMSPQLKSTISIAQSPKSPELTKPIPYIPKPKSPMRKTAYTIDYLKGLKITQLKEIAKSEDVPTLSRFKKSNKDELAKIIFNINGTDSIPVSALETALETAKDASFWALSAYYATNSVRMNDTYFNTGIVEHAYAAEKLAHQAHLLYIKIQVEDDPSEAQKLSERIQSLNTQVRVHLVDARKIEADLAQQL